MIADNYGARILNQSRYFALNNYFIINLKKQEKYVINILISLL